MKTFNKIARFVVTTITSAITIFFFMILLFRTDLLVDLFSSKPVLLLLGLTIGGTIGLLVGVIATYMHYAKELARAKSEVRKLENELNKAEGIMKEFLPTIKWARKYQKEISAKKSSDDIISQIGELSENDENENLDEVFSSDEA